MLNLMTRHLAINENAFDIWPRMAVQSSCVQRFLHNHIHKYQHMGLFLSCATLSTVQYCITAQ